MMDHIIPDKQPEQYLSFDAISQLGFFLRKDPKACDQVRETIPQLEHLAAFINDIDQARVWEAATVLNAEAERHPLQRLVQRPNKEQKNTLRHAKLCKDQVEAHVSRFLGYLENLPVENHKEWERLLGETQSQMRLVFGPLGFGGVGDGPITILPPTLEREDVPASRVRKGEHFEPLEPDETPAVAAAQEDTDDLAIPEFAPHVSVAAEPVSQPKATTVRPAPPKWQQKLSSDIVAPVALEPIVAVLADANDAQAKALGKELYGICDTLDITVLADAVRVARQGEKLAQGHFTNGRLGGFEEANAVVDAACERITGFMQHYREWERSLSDDEKRGTAHDAGIGLSHAFEDSLTRAGITFEQHNLKGKYQLTEPKIAAGVAIAS